MDFWAKLVCDLLASQLTRDKRRSAYGFERIVGNLTLPDYVRFAVIRELTCTLLTN